MPTWRNWNGEQRCAPAALLRPGSEDEVAAAVTRAAAAGHVVRVAGAGHSFTGAVLTDGTLLDLGRMDAVLDADAQTGLVRVQAGITIKALSEQLAHRGLALENLGDINVQSIAGATATGTHGTGAALRNISASITAARLVLADGSALDCSEADDADAWRAARVSVGALGVVTELTLQCMPLFTLRGVDAPQPLDDVFARLDELAGATRHFEFFAFPHTRVALTRTNELHDGPPQPQHHARRWLEETVIENAALGAVCRIGRRVPRAIPRLNRLIAGAVSTRERIDRSDRIFSSRRLVRFVEMEYALPRAAAADAIPRILAAAERHPVNFPIEVRFVAGDDALLSPAGGRDTVYIAVHVYRGMQWEPYFKEVEAIADEHGGRPHWGKQHFQSADTLAPRYPEWDRFQAVRDRLDPDRRFANAYVERVLGP